MIRTTGRRNPITFAGAFAFADAGVTARPRESRPSGPGPGSACLQASPQGSLRDFLVGPRTGPHPRERPDRLAHRRGRARRGGGARNVERNHGPRRILQESFKASCMAAPWAWTRPTTAVRACSTPTLTTSAWPGTNRRARIPTSPIAALPNRRSKGGRTGNRLGRPTGGGIGTLLLQKLWGNAAPPAPTEPGAVLAAPVEPIVMVRDDAEAPKATNRSSTPTSPLRSASAWPRFWPCDSTGPFAAGSSAAAPESRSVPIASHRAPWGRTPPLGSKRVADSGTPTNSVKRPLPPRITLAKGGRAAVPRELPVPTRFEVV